MTIGSSVGLVNGVPVMMDAPAYISDNRTMVPLRFVSEGLGFGVDYYKDTMSIYGDPWEQQANIDAIDMLNCVESITPVDGSVKTLINGRDIESLIPPEGLSDDEFADWAVSNLVNDDGSYTFTTSRDFDIDFGGETVTATAAASVERELLPGIPDEPRGGYYYDPDAGRFRWTFDIYQVLPGHPVIEGEKTREGAKCVADLWRAGASAVDITDKLLQKLEDKLVGKDPRENGEYSDKEMSVYAHSKIIVDLTIATPAKLATAPFGADSALFKVLADGMEFTSLTLSPPEHVTEQDLETYKAFPPWKRS